MKKIITLIKTSKTLFKFLVYLYYFYRRIYKFFTETNERKEYYTQIEEIKRNKKIIVDPLCQDTCPLSNLSIQTKAGGGK